MTKIEKLLRPRSIAVIGGGSWGKNVVEKSRALGFTGEIWPVHPSRSEIGGAPAFASVADLPGAPDAAFIGVNRHATIDAVAALRARGCGGVVCFASGFRESESESGDGSDLQERLLQAAGDMVLIGPNCYGFVNYLDGALLWPDQHGGERVESGVAILTQSSNISMNISMQRRGLPIAYVATAGNQAQTSLAQFGTALLEDPRVTCLGLHIEGISDLPDFENLARRARELGKPVIALKVGASEQAQQATISHTASLAGSDAGARALLARLGIAQISSLSVFIETLKLLHVAGPLASNRIASLSCSGGEASLIADAALPTNLTFPPLEQSQKAALRDALGPMVALANPLDYHTYIWGDQAALEQSFTALMKGDLAMGLVILDLPRTDRCSRTEWNAVLDAVKATRAQCNKPMGVVACFHENMHEDVARDLIAAGVIPFCGLDDTLAALEAGAYLGGNHPAALGLLYPKSPINPAMLAEADAKKMLARYGLKVPLSGRAKNPREAAAIAKEIGLLLVLKGEGIAHKTEAGAVVLGLTSPEMVETAANNMQADSFLIEEMITDSLAELLIGVVLDPAHGYVLTLAAGGILTELLSDSQSLLLPITRNDAQQALQSLKIHRILAGYRGKPAANINAIIDAIMAVQDYVIDRHGKLAEVEINPLICTPQDAWAADALIREGESND